MKVRWRGAMVGRTQDGFSPVCSPGAAPPGGMASAKKAPRRRCSGATHGRASPPGPPRRTRLALLSTVLRHRSGVDSRPHFANAPYSFVGGSMSISHPDALKALIEEYVPDLVATRRDLHEYPELAFEEVRTSGIVARRLQALGMEVQTGIAKTGVTGLLRGGAAGADAKTIAMRAAM